jgi:hypothetical protein
MDLYVVTARRPCSRRWNLRLGDCTSQKIAAEQRNLKVVHEMQGTKLSSCRLSAVCVHLSLAPPRPRRRWPAALNSGVWKWGGPGFRSSERTSFPFPRSRLVRLGILLSRHWPGVTSLAVFSLWEALRSVLGWPIYSGTVHQGQTHSDRQAKIPWAELLSMGALCQRPAYYYYCWSRAGRERGRFNIFVTKEQGPAQERKEGPSSLHRRGLDHLRPAL